MSKTDQSSCDILIIGGGVLGVSLAYHLRNSNFKVTLLEGEPAVATHASGLNAGMFRQLYRHPQLTKWANSTINSIPQQLKDECFKETGSVIVGRFPPAHGKALFEATEVEVNGEKLAAVYTKCDGLLDSPTFVEKLAKAARQDGVQFRLNSRVTTIQRSSNRWLVETSRSEEISARIVVNCCGAWLNSLFQQLPSLQVAAHPYARHLFLISGWPSNYMPAKECGFFWDETNSWYLRLWDKDTRLVSICDETAAIPGEYVPPSDIAEQLSEKLVANISPKVANSLQIRRSWHCFRTYTTDSLPIWGWDESEPDLFWLASFGGFGMSTGFAAAKDAAETISSKSELLMPEFAPSRVKLKLTKSHAIG